MKVLVACEYSGLVRDAFIKEGHDAVSCDILQTERPGPHYQGNVLDITTDAWDLMVAHPPCTHLAVSGARWFKDKKLVQAEAIAFFMSLVHAPIPRIAIENPIGIMSTYYKKPSQYIHPWEYGHGETKKTCLWLKNLPKLLPTDIVSGREAIIHSLWGKGKERSLTYQGWAKAMAEQWGHCE